MSPHLRKIVLIALLLTPVALTLRAALLQPARPATSESPRAQLFQFDVVGDGLADDTEAIQ